MRVTKKQLRSMLYRVNEAAGVQPDQTLGSYQLEYNSAHGWAMVEIVNEAGGEHDVFGTRATAGEMFRLMGAFLEGLEIGKNMYRHE